MSENNQTVWKTGSGGHGSAQAGPVDRGHVREQVMLAFTAPPWTSVSQEQPRGCMHGEQHRAVVTVITVARSTHAICPS